MPQTDEVTSLTQQLPHFYQLVDIKTGADATPEQLQNSLDSAENLLGMLLVNMYYAYMSMVSKLHVGDLYIYHMQLILPTNTNWWGV